MNTAIIVAAGGGTRFGSGSKAKQFLEICGKPVVVHALEKFESCPQIDEIVLVLPAADIKIFSTVLVKYNFQKLAKTVAGGENRSASVRNGFAAIDARACEIVAVHDGARPLVTIDEISRTIDAARKDGAACLVAEAVDTIKEVAGGKIVRTIDRNNLRRALTPQAFRYEILDRAFRENNLAETTAATDESSLAENIGVAVSIVEGGAQNIKITRAEDLVLAESLLKQFKVESGDI